MAPRLIGRLAFLVAAFAWATPTAATAPLTPYALANRCVRLESRAARRLVTAGPFYVKPTGLGTDMLYDPGQRLLSVTAHDRLTRTSSPGPAAQWRLAMRGGLFTITSTADGRQLAPAGPGQLALEPVGARFQIAPGHGCAAYPEAQLGAFGRPRSSVNRDGTVFGFADYHLEVTASFRAGGSVIDGEDFDPFGVTVALSAAGDQREHGPDGTLDVTGNLLRSGLPVGTHDNHGWPTFAGWPTYDTYTHQQDYWRWLERVWKAGLRLIVVQTSEDAELCNIQPRRAHTCNETQSIQLQVQNLHQLQNYIDAQSGGPGRGFFQLVYTPAQARNVIERGKLAAVIGVESSNPFGCGEFQGRALCKRADIDRGLALWWRLGIRSFFPVHWVDNAFAGAAFEGGATGTFLNLLNKLQTGHYFAAERCPLPGEGEKMLSVGHFFPGTDPISRLLNGVESVALPTYPSNPVCNAKGLTSVGSYLIRRMIAQHFMIDVDHMSEKARESVLGIAGAARYPLISSHTGTGGEWPPRDLRRLYRLGGLASVTPDVAPALVKKLLALRSDASRRYFFGVGLGTDSGGFGALPGPRSDAASRPLRYPFRSYNGMKFARQRTGQRVFDLNTDGVAQYGQFADLLGDAQQQARGRKALAVLFRSAEAYLEAWKRAFGHR
jgi:microsomal dipeptidase-like Zn-dependent dipeptidase